MLALKFLLTLLVAIMVVFFVVINGHSVDINYYNHTFEFKTLALPLSMLLIVATLVGFLSAWIFGAIEHMRLKGIIRKQSKTIRVKDQELDAFSDQSMVSTGLTTHESTVLNET